MAPAGWRAIGWGDHVASGLQKLKPPLPVRTSGAGDWVPRCESIDRRPPGGGCMHTASCLMPPTTQPRLGELCSTWHAQRAAA